MSSQQLHDLLGQLKLERENGDMVDSEYQLRLDEIIESLEQQKMYPEAFDQYSGLGDQVRALFEDMESKHPSIRALLDGIYEVLQNFRT
jgi:hypothetical protein